MDLEALRAENIAAWSRDPVLPDFALVANTSSSRYIPALEAEVERLREGLRIACESTLVLVAHAAACNAEIERLQDEITERDGIAAQAFRVDL